ncbi:MAG: crotonobetainyl-CoA--carnitine CoA-transferase [Proteobacteria bacterium]|nr:crotonobetainyl-CoA--carnitine CoA-transferase [Pseudomonadota bacterium]
MHKTQQHDAIVLSNSSEKDASARLAQLLAEAPIPRDELLPNLGLFLTSKSLSRVLFFYEVYKQIVDTHGVIAEFGVRWGQTLSLMEALRGILEPFNRHRKIIGFDTFEGARGFSAQVDGALSGTGEGSFSVPAGYEATLEQILSLQEALNPMSHIKRFELVKGDAAETLPAYLERHPETLFSMAILDMDIYRPTRAVLETIAPRLFRGSVLVFDELCDEYFPGETVALMETLGTRGLRLKRYPMTARVSYAVIE